MAQPVRADESPAAEEIAFARYEISTGSADRQTVVPGFFLGAATAEIAVLHLDENDDRRLRLYGFDGTAWVPVLEATLGPEVQFVDVADVGGRDRLITYASGRLNWFDPDSAAERALVELEVDYNVTDEDVIPHVDITRDLNRDGRDDLVVPDVDGFWISLQTGNGSFTDAVKLGPPEPYRDAVVGNIDTGDGATSDDARTYGDVGITAQTIPVYLSRVHQMDYDQDGRSDLVFWNEDHFDVHLQDERGLFDPVAETFTVDAPFYAEGVYARAFEYSDEGVFSILFGFGEKTEQTVLHSIRDLNGDGVADLVTLTLTGRSITRQRSRYEVHFGRSSPAGIVFAPGAGTAIHPGGKAGGMQPWGYASQWFEDFDGDGFVDVLFRDVAVGIGGMGRALVGNSVPIDLEYYRMEDGAFPDEPTATRRIRRFDPLDGLGHVYFPPVLLGDVNGDGRPDLVVGQSPDELHIFSGVPGPRPFADEPRKVAVALPYDERNTRLVDLDRDGKQDILIHHPSGDEAHRVMLLVVQ